MKRTGCQILCERYREKYKPNNSVAQKHDVKKRGETIRVFDHIEKTYRTIPHYLTTSPTMVGSTVGWTFITPRSGMLSRNADLDAQLPKGMENCA